MKAVLKIYLILAVVGGIAFVLSLFTNPCIIYHVAGLPCPACGLTRAIVSLTRLQPRQAFMYHPLFIVLPFLPLLVWERIPLKLRNIIAFVLVGMFIAVWIARMLMFFPNTPPMTYNQDSLIERLIRLLSR